MVLTEMSLKASFFEYVTYGMHNQHIMDVKEFGERFLQFGVKREEPMLLSNQHHHQHQYRISKATGPLRSMSPYQRHRADNRNKRRDSPTDARGVKAATDGHADTRHSTNTTRPHN